MSCFFFELFYFLTMELGGTGVDEMEGWADGKGLGMIGVWFLNWGRSSLLFLHLIYMQKRKKGPMDNEMTGK